MSISSSDTERWLREVTTPLGQARVPCRQCSLQAVCDTIAPEGEDNGLIQRSRVGSGKYLFRAGERFHGVYAVTSGAIKTFAQLNDQASQVVDFYFPGDTVGLEAVDRQTYSYSAQALTETLVCRIDVAHAPEMGARFGEFQVEMIRALGEQLRHEQSLSILLRNQSAEQRISTFLLSLAGPSLWANPRGVDLQLPMSRKDIANYLGIAVETLCRLLKRMQEDGLVESHGRHMRLINIEALTELSRPTTAGNSTGCSA